MFIQDLRVLLRGYKVHGYRRRGETITLKRFKRCKNGTLSTDTGKATDLLNIWNVNDPFIVFICVRCEWQPFFLRSFSGAYVNWVLKTHLDKHAAADSSAYMRILFPDPSVEISTFDEAFLTGLRGFLLSAASDGPLLDALDVRLKVIRWLKETRPSDHLTIDGIPDTFEAVPLWVLSLPKEMSEAKLNQLQSSDMILFTSQGRERFLAVMERLVTGENISRENVDQRIWKTSWGGYVLDDAIVTKAVNHTPPEGAVIHNSVPPQIVTDTRMLLRCYLKGLKCHRCVSVTSLRTRLFYRLVCKFDFLELWNATTTAVNSGYYHVNVNKGDSIFISCVVQKLFRQITGKNIKLHFTK
ncbi:UNVERIFIED_CONTAM: hypothetical protein FKN15_005926 [Acipenser sinensis]